MTKMLTVIAMLVMLAITSVAASAQDATPVAYPHTPDPALCQVEPRSAESIADIVATPVAGDVTAATPFVQPEGEPADAATAQAVMATITELFACANAGDFLRIFALYTDDFLRDFLAGTPINEEVLAFFVAPPMPLPDEERRIIIRFGEVEVLPDGRAGVVVVLDEPDDPRTEEPDFVFLEQVGDRWLVDAVVEDGGMTGTPTP